MKLKQLKGGVRRITIDVPPEEDGGEVEQVWVDYRPGELNLEVADELKAMIGQEKNMEDMDINVLRAVLEPVLVDWDVEDEDENGNTIHLPPKEGLTKVPLMFLGQVLLALNKDMQPDPTKSPNSNDSSNLTDELGSPQSGTESSESQTDSDAYLGRSSNDPPGGTT